MCSLRIESVPESMPPAPVPLNGVIIPLLQKFRRYWPKTLRTRLLLIVMPLVALPIIATGYVLKGRSTAAILEEKRTHLQGITALLERHLQEQGGFTGLLADYRGRTDDREAQRNHLNARLRAYTNTIAAAFDDVGVGYFSRELNAIITYGPSDQYGHTVGMTIPPEHPGWQVMADDTVMTVSGPQVRGQIMNAMRPLHQDEKVVGYVWANEMLDAIDRQTRAANAAVYTLMLLGLAFSLLFVYLAIEHLTQDIEKIRHGLETLSFDLNHPIPPIQGEIGVIIEAINELARSLLETRSMHNNILDSLVDGVITIDSQHHISYVNPAACALLGYSASEVVGKPYMDLFRPDADFSSLLIDTLQTGREHRTVELHYPLAEGALNIIASSSRLYDGQGQQLGAVTVLRDISENRALQNQVARASQLATIGEMSASIAHELRTPLTSIRGFVQYLQDSKDPAEWKEFGDIILREVDSLNKIATGLLDLARPQPLQTAPCSLNHLLEESLLLATKPRGKQITFRQQLAPDLPMLELDRGQIKQVILNLLMNAIQAIEQQGEITLTTRREAGEVILDIADTGCGIPAKDLERIFAPFFSSKPSGTGLGLPVARRIVESHYGKLELASQPEQGTVASLRLPISDSPS
jgi:two-component system sensor histidine kinase AtoS